MNEEIVSARAEYNRTLQAIISAGAGRNDGLEQAYGLAARRRVRLGDLNPIKRKYRGR